MEEKKKSRILAACLAALLAVALTVSPGCVGPFKLTSNLHDWNTSMESKWPQELVFLPLAFLVYPWTLIGDAVIFNSVEFWTGSNPIDVPDNVGK